ncbi:hypothetical protein [Aquirufa antheringensis]|uniref:hypothetical protein n=1 Tax=Aquirufa antheringensis TaxID=2516559 RepID=UPI001F8B1E0A|nr:hypothetical protein [Pseudarcicella sp. GAP-15]
MGKFSRLLFGLSFMLLLNSCSKEALMEPSEPYQELRQWYAFNKMTSTNEPVLWKYTIPFAMPDSSQAYQIPVMSKAGMKDLIIYSENGIQKGFYKLYTPKDETRINIQVLNLFDEVIRDGVLIKTKRVAKPRKKNELDGSTVKEMNVQLPDVYCIGQRLPMEGTLADIPIIYSEGGGSYNPSIPSFFGGGGGAPSSDSYDINFDPSEALLFSIGNNIKTKCLLESLNGVINSKYDFNRIISKFKVPQKTVFFTEGVNLIDDADATTKFISSNEVLITLNTRLKNYSKEYMALAIYHELLHAYMGTYKSEIWKNDEQHELMTGQNYLDIYLFEIGNLLKIRFPNASKDADKLIWAGGLTDTEYFKNHIKLDAKVEVEKTIRDYTNGNNGTYCKN